MLRLLNTTSVLKRLDKRSKETIRLMVKRKELPLPIKTEKGGNNYWLESDIDSYIESLIQSKREEK